MKEPLVSVFIPVYNGEKFIGNAINGILNQTYENLELIIVNDGSNDNTVDEIERITDSRIKLFHNEGNKGLVFTRNRGFELSNGKYFAINDADDFSHVDRIKTQVDFLENNKNIGICGSYANRVTSKEINVWKYPLRHYEIKEQLFWGSSIINSTAMFNLYLLNKSKLAYRKDFPPAEDYDLFQRAVNIFEIENINIVLVDYLEHENNVTFTQDDEMRDASTRISLRQAERLIGEISEKIKALHYRFQHFIFDFKFEELVELEKYLIRLLDANSKSNYYQIELFEKHISERFFQIVYHSKVNVVKFSNSQLIKNYNPSIIVKLKSFIKSIL